MANDDEVRERIGRLTDARWRELMAPGSAVGRRPRTIGVSAALGEVLELGNYARYAEEEDNRAPRGQAMLGDVRDEAHDILGRDHALQRNPALRDEVIAALPGTGDFDADPGKRAPAPTREALARLRAIGAHVDAEYLELMCASLNGHFVEKPSLVAFEEALEQLATYARWLGWSDAGLLALWNGVCQQSGDVADRVRLLGVAVGERPTTHSCRVTIDPGGLSGATFDVPHRGVRHEVMDGVHSLLLDVDARDPWAAAEAAHRRAATIVGAPNVFLDAPSSVRTTNVVVTHGGRETSVPLRNPLERDHHNPRKEQLTAVVELASRTDTQHDTLWDAVRNHHRALANHDIEASLILLWTAVERLCADPQRPEARLSLTADLISGAMALSKMRREVQNFADALTNTLRAEGRLSEMQLHHVDAAVLREHQDVVSHDTVWQAMVADGRDVKTFVGPFYDNVLMTQWFFRLRREVCCSSGTPTPEHIGARVQKLIENSRQRTRWQVKRIYRGRNVLAHGAGRGAFVSDLARHANYLLTNMLAICLSSTDGGRESPRTALERRGGWLDAYLRLARRGEPRAVSPLGVLKPADLFRRGLHGSVAR